MIKKLEDLNNWQLARKINSEVFTIVGRLSFNNDSSLRDQLNHSAASMMDKIAEGFYRSGNNEFIQFLGYSKGSCGELKSQFYRALDRRHIDESEFLLLFDKIDHVERMNSKLISYLQKKDSKNCKDQM
jgi:four helix bundle protein